MPESTKNNSLVNEYGQVEDQDLARKMADTEKEIRDTFTKTDDKAEVDLWANKASEGVFRQETGKEYPDELKEAQEETAYREKADQVEQEIKAEVSKVEEEIKSANEVVSKKEGTKEGDSVEANQSGENYQRSMQEAKDNAELKISSVVSRVEAGETDQDKLTKVKEKINTRLSKIQDMIDLLDGKKGGRGDVLTYLKKAAGIEDRNLTVEEEKIYWDRAMSRLKAEKQGYEVVNLFFDNNNSPADWEKFQKHLRFSLKSEKKLADEYINKIDKDPAVSNQNKPTGLLKEEAMRDSETIQGILLGLMDKNAQPEDSSESGSDIGEINSELRANQERIRNDLRSVEYAWSVFKSGEGEEYDALINQQTEDLGIADKPKETIEGLVRSRLENSRAALKEVRSILNKSNSIEEFNQEIQNYLDLTHKFEKKELNEASLIADTKKRGKKERKIKNKHRFAGEVLTQYLPPKKDGSKPADKPDVSVEAQSPTEGDTQKPSKNPTEQENDEAESKLKTNGPVYGKESIPEDAQEEAERIKNGKKAEGKKEEPASVEAMASKEKTAEEILREKNIDVYEGADRLNKIIEDYHRLSELEKQGASSDAHPLFNEWDKLRIDLTNVNLETISKRRFSMIPQRSEEVDKRIREYFDDVKILSESFEDFEKRIKNNAPGELTIQAAALIKYRNELADKRTQTKSAKLDKEIFDSEKKIQALEALIPRHPELKDFSLHDLLINNFEKAGVEDKKELANDATRVKNNELTNEQTARVEGVLKEFNLTTEDAEKIEGFKDLSYGQRLLALENLRQLTLRKVRDQALAENQSKTSEVAEQYAKTKGWKDGRWKKGWLDKVPAGAKLIQQGMTKYFSIARGKRRIKKDLSKEDYEEVLRDVVEGMREITKYDVEEKEGKLEVQYLSGLENLNDQEKVNVNRLNDIANELGRMPLSLEQLPMGLLKDKHTRAQKSKYEKLDAEYKQLLKGETEDGKSNQGILGLLERQARLDLKKEGKNDSDREVRIEALTQAGELENIIRLNRFFIENPDAEKELKKIKSGGIYLSVLKDTLAERGALLGFGYAARMISVKALTALGVASSITTGGVILASAAGIGGGIGGWRGWRRAEESLREMDAQARGKDFKSEESKGISREILMQKQRERQEQRESAAKKGEVAYKTITNKKGETIKLTGVFELSKEERMEKNIVDADSLANGLEVLRTQIEKTSDEIGESVAKEGQEGLQTKELIDKRFELAHRLEIRLGYTRRKLDGGLVNFGKNEEQAFNQMTLIDRLNLAVSYVELHKKPTAEKKPDEPSLDSGKIKSKEDKEPLTPEQRLERFLNFKSKKISQARKWHKLRQMGKGAAYGMVFAGAGASVRWFLEHYYGGGQIPPHEGSTPDGDVAGYESVVNQGTGSEKIKSVIDQFNKDFRFHPEWKNNLLEQAKALGGLRQQLVETAGIKDPDALKEIIDSAKEQLNGDGNVFIVKGGSQEAQNLAGIESTGGSGGGSTAEQTATAAGAGKSVDAVVGAKQDIVNSAIETASGKLDSVWKMAEHQLGQKGFFKDLSGTAEEIAAKKTYLIDAIEDKVAENPSAFGLEDVDDLAVDQKVDFSKIFENESVLKQILLAKADKLSPQEIASILTHNKNIADFHHFHPDVGIASENVDQIAAGHGDALLKKAVEQVAEQASVAPKAPLEDGSMIDVGEKIEDLKELGVSSDDLEKLTVKDIKDLTEEQMAQIKDYTTKIEALKKIGILENDINSLTEKDIRDLTPEQIKNLVLDKVSSPTESPQELVVDKEFFKEKPAVEATQAESSGGKTSEIERAAKMETSNNIKIDTDKFSGDIKFKYDASGNPTELLPIDHEELRRITGSEYFDKSNLKSFDYLTKADGKDLVARVEIFKQLNSNKDFKLADVVLEDIKKIATQLDERHNGIVDYSKFPQVLREKLWK